MKPLYKLVTIDLALEKLLILFVNGTNLQIKLSHSNIFAKYKLTL